jgi:D-3-phosphoglycerate dehydrogenase / 2-oxoglutarate reductase
MKPDVLLINTARGGIIDETDLAAALRAGLIGGAAIDVFESEPYSGELSTLDRCLLTSHMASMTDESRRQMELQATEDAVRFLTGQAIKQLVPDEEYAS